MDEAPEEVRGVLRSIRTAIQRSEHRYTLHAQMQMAVRHVTDAEAREVLLGEAAEIIENYPDDKYSPSCLICGPTASGRILHVQSNYQAVIITVYEPDPDKWVGFKYRRRT